MNIPIKFFHLLKRNKLRVFKKLLREGIDSNLSYVCDCSGLVEGSYNPTANFLSNSILTINLPFDLEKKEVLSVAKALNNIKDLLY